MPLDFDPDEIGIDELVHYPALMNLRRMQDMSLDEKGFLKANINDLIPRRIIYDDIYASVNYLMGLNHGIGKIDDIDHLGNRRVRSVGELPQNQLRRLQQAGAHNKRAYELARLRRHNAL